jgi:hypothetical protein
MCDRHLKLAKAQIPPSIRAAFDAIGVEADMGSAISYFLRKN